MARGALQWSPEQIAGWLKQEFPTHQDMQISREAIYRSLVIQTRGELKKELTAQLRTVRRRRRPKSHNAKSGQGQILDMVSIRERPAEIEDRAVPGHWEGDLLTGANDTHIATLVERNTRFTMLVRIPRKDTTTVVAALAKHIGKLPEGLRRSLTWDQGKEMHAHKRFTVATNVQVYFCDPRSPWQRGSNENTNGLLRQYFPRGTDFSRISQSYLNAIALRLTPGVVMAPAHLIVPDDGQQAAMQDDELLAKRPPDDQQRFDQHGQVGQVLHQFFDSGSVCRPTCDRRGSSAIHLAKARRYSITSSLPWSYAFLVLDRCSPA